MAGKHVCHRAARCRARGLTPVEDSPVSTAAALRAQDAVAAAIPLKSVLRAFVDGAAAVSAATIVRTGGGPMVTKQMIPLTRFAD